MVSAIQIVLFVCLFLSGSPFLPCFHYLLSCPYVVCQSIRSDLGLGFLICNQCLLGSPLLSGVPAPNILTMSFSLALQTPQEPCLGRSNLDRCFQNPANIFLILLLPLPKDLCCLYPGLPQGSSAVFSAQCLPGFLLFSLRRCYQGLSRPQG